MAFEVKGYESLNKDSIESYLANQGRLIELMKDVRENIKFQNDSNLLEFINTAQFYAINIFDLLIALKSMITTERYVERNLYARLAGLICYQIIRQGRDVTGKKFRDSLINISENDVETIEVHDKIKKIIVAFDNTNKDFFNEIRNISIAHRNEDLGQQIEFIERLDVEVVFKLAADLFVIADRYVLFLAEFTRIFKNRIQDRLFQ